MSSPKSSNKKSHKGLALVALIIAATVFGLIIGLGGSLLLTHSIIQRPIQEQQAIINLQHVQHLQEVSLLQQELALQQEAIAALKGELNYFILADSTGYLKELASIQRENQSREEIFVQQLEQLSNQAARLDFSNQELIKEVDNLKKEMDRTELSAGDDIRMLQNALNDLRSKLQQLERQINSQ